jgi:flavin-dependent dehydrogenase
MDAIVIGGGPAGAAVGLLLAQQGRSVEIVEKSAAMHDSVCGEFLSREAVLYLQGLGVDLQALGAVRIDGVRLFGRELGGFGLIAESTLGFAAMSLTRRVLDEALLQQAAAAGASVLRGRRVSSLTREDAGWTVQLSDGERRYAADAFLATGKHDLNGYARERGAQNDLVAFKMYFKLALEQQAELAGHVELILFPGGYAGLQPVENGVANLCLLVTRKKLKQCGGDWAQLLEAMQSASAPLARRLDGAEAMLERPLALSAIPYGMLRAHAKDGLWRLGDQAAVIPSFSGDGMSIALHSAHLAAATYLGGGTAEDFQRQLRRELRPAVTVATALSRMMIAHPMLAHGVRVWPQLLHHIASRTRVPARALRALQGEV